MNNLLNINYSPTAPKLLAPSSANEFRVTLTQVPGVPGPVYYTYSADIVVENTPASTYAYSISVDGGAQRGTITPSTNDSGVVLSANRIDSGTYDYPGVDAIVNFSGIFGTVTKSIKIGSIAAPSVSTGSFKDGSFAAYCYQLISTEYSGKPVADNTVKLFSSINFTGNILTTSATLNTNRVFNAIDLSWISVYRKNPSIVEEPYPCCLITPIHALVAKHTEISIGSTVTFRRTDGTFQEVSVVSSIDIVTNTAQSTDMRIVKLSTPVTGCSIAQLLDFRDISKVSPYMYIQDSPNKPSWYGLNTVCAAYNSYSTTYTAGRKLIPMLWEQDNVLGLGEVALAPPADPNLQNFYFMPYPGESSSPVFIPISTPGGVKCALVTLLYSASSGPSVPTLIDQINAAIVSLGADGYASTRADLNFPDYSSYFS